MKEHSNEYTIERMAEVFEVSRSGYYAWLNRPESRTSKHNRLLLERIREIHQKSGGIYGSRKIHQVLIHEGFRCCLKVVARLMKENGIRSKTVKRFKAYSNKKSQARAAVNVVNRDFKVSEADKIWVSDITYIYTLEGWYYLCVIIDLYSRNVVGWSGGKNIDTELVLQALDNACISRQPSEGVIFHSDRGSQYTSDRFKEELLERGFIRSMSRKGNCWDNAVAESFFHSLKIEEVYQNSYKTREEASISIFRYIEIFYKRERIHSYLGYLTPVEFEAGRRGA